MRTGLAKISLPYLILALVLPVAVVNLAMVKPVEAG